MCLSLCGQNKIKMFIAKSKLPHLFFLFVFYVFVGVSYFHGFDKLSLLNSVYFSVVTFATVGYGDIHPNSQHSKIFACFFIMLGLVLVGYFMTILGQAIIENERRMRSKHQKRVTTALTKIAQQRLQTFHQKFRSKLSFFKTKSPSNMKWDIEQHNEVSSPIHANEQEETEPQEDSISIAAAYNISFEYEMMKLRRKATYSIFMILTLLTSATVIMAFFENWTLLDSFYWACVTITTVGYGDYTPQTVRGKIFAIFYICFGCILISISLQELIKFPIAMEYKKREMRVIREYDTFTRETLSKITSNQMFDLMPSLKTTGSEHISKIEFVLGLLFALQKVDAKDVLLAVTTFDKLDIDKNGMLCNPEMDLVPSKNDLPSKPQLPSTLQDKALTVVRYLAFGEIPENFNGTNKTTLEEEEDNDDDDDDATVEEIYGLPHEIHQADIDEEKHENSNFGSDYHYNYKDKTMNDYKNQYPSRLTTNGQHYEKPNSYHFNDVL